MIIATIRIMMIILITTIRMIVMTAAILVIMTIIIRMRRIMVMMILVIVKMNRRIRMTRKTHDDDALFFISTNLRANRFDGCVIKMALIDWPSLVLTQLFSFIVSLPRLAAKERKRLEKLERVGGQDNPAFAVQLPRPPEPVRGLSNISTTSTSVLAEYL